MSAGQTKAETLSVGLSSTAPSIGKVASGTSTTNFVVNAATGSVSVGSGGGQFVPYNASRTALTTITISCSGGSKCNGNNVTVTITSGSATGRAGTISAWSADFTGGVTAVLAAGGNSVSSSTSSLSFVIKPVAAKGQTSGSATFHLGLTLPINTTGTVGTATAAYSISATGSGMTTGSGAAAAQASVEGSLSMSKQSDLSFGRLVLLAGQSGTATWAASNQSWTLTNAIAMTTHTIGQFTVTGSPNQAINFSIPSTITMTNAHGDTIPITVSTTGQGTQVIGSTGAFVFYVGGQISFSGGSSPTKTGAYTATFTVSANYQ